MILILSSEYDPHADLIIKELQRRKESFLRLNAEDLFEKFTGTFLHLPTQKRSEISHATIGQCNLEDISLVYQRGFSLESICPYPEEDLNRFFRDDSIAFIYGLLFAADIPWFNHPFNLEPSAHKLNQLSKASALGFEVPATCVSNDANEVQAFAERHGTIIQKVLNRSRLRDDEKTATLSYTRILGSEDLVDTERIAVLPSIYQSYIQKKVEVRITVIGNKAVTVAIGSENEEKKVDWRKGDLSKVPHAIHQLPVEIERMCIQLVSDFGLRYGAIDMIVTPDDYYVFLELNPEGLWGWLEVLTEANITTLIVDEMLQS